MRDLIREVIASRGTFVIWYAKSVECARLGGLFSGGCVQITADNDENTPSGSVYLSKIYIYTFLQNTATIVN